MPDRDHQVLPANAIEIHNLSKTYKPSHKTPAKTALDDVSLTIPRGKIIGLLGPNGAGKSTLINILAGLVVKSGGTASIWGRDIDDSPRNAKAAIGIVPQEITFDPFFTPRAMLDIQAGLYGVPKAERRSMELLDMVGLADKADSYARSLSGGMRRRLMIAKAMVHNPPILVLDEPTAGVDVELRQMLWEKVRMLNEQGVTVLLTTHYLEEAQELCERIAIINHGKIAADEDKNTLLSRIENKEIHLHLDREVTEVPAGLEQFAAHIAGPRTLIVRYAPKDQAVEPVFDAVRAAGYGICDVTTEQSDLEDIFLQITRAA